MRRLLCLALAVAATEEVILDRCHTGQDLRTPEIFRSENGVLAVTLRVGVATLKLPTTTLKTRVFNGQFPGPTLMIRPGDTLTITLFNDLEDIDNRPEYNAVQLPNSTNLHTHGLHQSPNSPGDDVFVTVHPGESRTYTYHIDPAHMGGHHWFGSLIVQDSEGEVPKSLMNTETTVLDILSLPHWAALKNTRDGKPAPFKGSPSLQRMQNYFNQALLQPNPDVNGAVAPRIALERNVWRRFRIVYASTWWSLLTMIAGSEPGATGNACEWRLLAKDGVYVAEAPRNFGVLPMTPASRTDILLRCTEVGKFGRREFDWYGSDVDAPIFGEDSTNLATIYGGSPKDVNPWGEEYGDMKRKRIYPTTVATLVVTDSLKVAVEPVQFKPNRPCYAVDLMDAPVDRAVWNLDSPKFINFLKMPEDHVASHLFEIDVGSVVEMELEGANIHPIHIHVNHQQLIESGPGLRGYHEDAMGGFTRLGDWHDTAVNGSETARRQLIL
ncbi:hypothetical protein M885DRAFT_565092 [Pelagophyceae sp. CCMP2097]|nr:hypothetical protein M885DRAFT_565092 [Pelagophyceae sp. CCMP2097]